MQDEENGDVPDVVHYNDRPRSQTITETFLLHPFHPVMDEGGTIDEEVCAEDPRQSPHRPEGTQIHRESVEKAVNKTRPVCFLLLCGHPVILENVVADQVADDSVRQWCDHNSSLSSRLNSSRLFQVSILSCHAV